MRNPTTRAARIARPTPCIRVSATAAPFKRDRGPPARTRAGRPRSQVDLHLRQYVLAETPHVGDHRVGGDAFEAEIDMADTKIAERPQIGDDIRHLSREQPPLTVIGAIR